MKCERILLVNTIGFDEGPTIRSFFRTRALGLCLLYPCNEGLSKKRLEVSIETVRQLANLADVELKEICLDLKEGLESALIDIKSNIYSLIEERSYDCIYLFFRGGLHVLNLLVLLVAQSLSLRHRNVYVLYEDEEGTLQKVRALDLVPEVLDPMEEIIVRHLIFLHKNKKNPCAGVREISNALDIPRSSVHRKLRILLNKGMVVQNKENKYCLTFKALVSL